MMNLANPKTHEADNASIIPGVGESVRVAADYLLESVLGSCFLTGSRDLDELAACEAIAVHVDWVQSAPVSFSPQCRDLPAFAMTFTAGLLSRDWHMSMGTCPSYHALDLHSSESDMIMARRVAVSPYPTRRLSDCGYMRRRIQQVAGCIPSCDDWRGTARYLGRCAGPKYEHAALALMNGGAR